MQKKLLLILLCLFVTADISASYYYLKFGTTIPPNNQNALPSLGIGGRLKCGLIDFDLSLTGSAKKRDSYITAKGLVLFFTGQQFYLGAGGGIAYSAKTPIIKLLQGGPKSTIVNLEGVIGFENCGKFIQLECSKPLHCSHDAEYKMGFAVTFGFMF